MTYDTAKKLKDAGYPQPEDGDDEYPGYFSCGCAERRKLGIKSSEVYDCGNDRYYFPTLSELIEACGDVIIKLWCNKKLGEYGIQEEGTGLKEVVWYPTPEEAVANLWLELNKKHV